MEGVHLKELKVYSRFLIFIAFITLSSCAKLGYVWEQGIGQLSIQWSAKDNQRILADSSVNEQVKSKIRAIIKAKKFFEELYQIELEDIYEKTTFLDRDAVSYMVTASPINEVRPYRVSFPFVGEFPYLAFFKKKSALKFAAKLQKKNLVTWMRPVQAYSSLNYFDDRILSSFFVFDEFELVELVFHELTHLTLFIKNNVGFNESLAQFIAHKTLEIYLKGQADDFIKRRSLSRALSKDLVPMIQELNQLYRDNRDGKQLDPNLIRENFLITKVFPRFQKYCDESSRKCKLEVKNWNNARMVGYLNYEQTYERIETIYIEKYKSVTSFMKFLQTQYRDYLDLDDENMSFLKFLEKNK